MQTVAQIQESVRAFHQVLGDAFSSRTQLTFLVVAMRRRVDTVWLYSEPLLRAFRQVFGEFLSRQTHLKVLATRMRGRVDAILLQSKPLLHKSHLYGTPSSRKNILTLVTATVAGLALIVLLVEMDMSNQVGNEHTTTGVGATSSPSPSPDWTVFDDAFAIQPTSPLASEFADRVRTSGATAMSDRAETSAQVLREPVPLPRARPKPR
jgi:hypothetical protein